MPEFSVPVEAEELMRHGSLMTSMEPYIDESITKIDINSWAIQEVNQYLEDIYDWETAPVLPISQWFDPPLQLPHPRNLSDKEIHTLLYQTLWQLFDKKIVFDCTEYLSERDFYSIIFFDILPSLEKNLKNKDCYIHWNLAKGDDEESVLAWLTYFADNRDRNNWQIKNPEKKLPDRKMPPYHHHIPKAPDDIQF